MADDPGNVPTQEQMAQGAAVIEAGQEAAAAEPDEAKKRGAARSAIRQKAKSSGWELTDDQADKLAGAITGKIEELFEALPGNTAEAIRQMGGFDKLPEPLAAPAAPTGGGTLPAEPAGAPAPPAGGDEAPGGGRARGASSFARWFRGG